MKFHLAKHFNATLSLDWMDTSHRKLFRGSDVLCRSVTVPVDITPVDNRPSEVEKCALIKNLLEKDISIEKFGFILTRDWFWYLDLAIGVSEDLSKKGGYLWGLIKLKSQYPGDILHKLTDLFDGVKVRVNFSVRKYRGDDAPLSYTVFTKAMSMDQENKAVFQDLKLLFPEAARSVWMVSGERAHAQVTVTVTIPDGILSKRFGGGTPWDKALLVSPPLQTFDGKDNVKILCEDGFQVKAHRSFLVERSSVFSAMFQSDMKESRESSVEILDMEAKSVRAFLKFLYSGDTYEAEEDFDVAFDLLKAAHKYDVNILEEKMKDLIANVPSNWIELDLAVHIFMFARHLKPPDVHLKAKSVEVIKIYNATLDQSHVLQELFQNDIPAALELLKLAIESD